MKISIFAFSLLFVLALFVSTCTTTETSESLRARLSVRRNNLKAGDSKVETVTTNDAKNGDLRARLTRMFKPQQPQQQQPQPQQQPQVEVESEDSVFLEVAVDVNNSTASNEEDGVVLSTYVALIEAKVKAQIELFEKAIASAKEAQRQKNIKVLAELMAQMQAVEEASSSPKVDVDVQMAQIEEAIAKEEAVRKAEIEQLIEHIRPSLEQAEAAEREPKKTIGIRNELKFSYAAIKNAINAVQDFKVKELLVEIALRYPRVGATLGLFNNNNKETSNVNATETTNGDSEVVPSEVASPTQQQQQPTQRKSFLERDVKAASQDVNPATLAVNAAKLRQQLSKMR